jgi:hypothetical protein
MSAAADDRPDWELSMNPTSPAELRALSQEVFELSHAPQRNDDLESRTCMSCNPLMDGDSGWAFTSNMKGALGFISQLLRLRADELDRLRPSYCKIEGTTTS